MIPYTIGGLTFALGKPRASGDDPAWGDTDYWTDE